MIDVIHCAAERKPDIAENVRHSFFLPLSILTSYHRIQGRSCTRTFVSGTSSFFSVSTNTVTPTPTTTPVPDPCRVALGNSRSGRCDRTDADQLLALVFLCARPRLLVAPAPLSPTCAPCLTRTMSRLRCLVFVCIPAQLGGVACS